VAAKLKKKTGQPSNLVLKPNAPCHGLTHGHCQICRPGARTIWRLPRAAPSTKLRPGRILTPSSVVKSKNISRRDLTRTTVSGPGLSMTLVCWRCSNGTGFFCRCGGPRSVRGVKIRRSFICTSARLVTEFSDSSEFDDYHDRHSTVGQNPYPYLGPALNPTLSIFIQTEKGSRRDCMQHNNASRYKLVVFSITQQRISYFLS
jgi:hypothetical protein